MEQIILSRGEGKTYKLLKYAQEHGCVFLSDHPSIMRKYADSLGFGNVLIEGYDYVDSYAPNLTSVVIDELEYFLKCRLKGIKVEGYSLTSPSEVFY